MFKSKKEIPELTHMNELTNFVTDEESIVMNESELDYHQVFIIVIVL